MPTETIVPVSAALPARPDKGWRVRPSEWARFMRVHQWSKNLLLFLPLAFGHAYTDPGAILACGLGFVALSLAASATYLVNDVMDAEADRAHPTKCRRLVAAGRVGRGRALLVAAGLLAAGLVLGSLGGRVAVVAILVYAASSLLYSLQVKRVPMLDVIWVGLLYTLRIVMGGEIAGLRQSPWLLSFSALFFVSLAMAKRHAEVHGAHHGLNVIKGRGYRPEDWALTLSSGVASLFAALVVLVLYLSEEVARVGIYGTPAFLWGCPVVIAAWSLRIWLLAHRGELKGDPVSFALRDPSSLIHGAVAILCFVLATLRTFP